MNDVLLLNDDTLCVISLSDVQQCPCLLLVVGLGLLHSCWCRLLLFLPSDRLLRLLPRIRRCDCCPSRRTRPLFCRLRTRIVPENCRLKFVFVFIFYFWDLPWRRSALFLLIKAWLCSRVRSNLIVALLSVFFLLGIASAAQLLAVDFSDSCRRRVE